MNIKSGTVLYPAGKVFDGKWGKRQSLKIKLADGSEEAIWFSEGRQPHTSLQKGDLVQILFEEKNGKQQRRLIVQDQGTPSLTLPQARESKGYEPLEPETKREIASYVQEMAKLYHHCLKTVTAEMPELPIEQAKCVSTTLFISSQRKFNL
jgi:nitrous oxide reductase accessory protein NosL